MGKVRLNTQALDGSLYDAQVATDASIQETKILFDTGTDGHNHDGTNSREIAAQRTEVWHETPTGTINSTNTLFTLATAPYQTNVQPLLNGVALNLVPAATDNDDDDEFYMVSGETVITLGDAPRDAPGNPDLLVVHYEKA